MRWAVEISYDVVRRIIEEVPALGGGTAAIETLRRGNEATTLRALFALAGGAVVATTTEEATLNSVRDLVHRGVPLEHVLQGVRVGHGATTEAFLRACAELVDAEAALGEVTAVSGSGGVVRFAEQQPYAAGSSSRDPARARSRHNVNNSWSGRMVVGVGNGPSRHLEEPS